MWDTKHTRTDSTIILENNRIIPHNTPQLGVDVWAVENERFEHPSLSGREGFF